MTRLYDCPKHGQVWEYLDPDAGPCVYCNWDAEVRGSLSQVLRRPAADEWMVTENPALEGRRPVDLLGTWVGYSRVMALILAIAEGVTL